jgi:hypothetical protein
LLFFAEVLPAFALSSYLIFVMYSAKSLLDIVTVSSETLFFAFFLMIAFFGTIRFLAMLEDSTTFFATGFFAIFLDLTFFLMVAVILVSLPLTSRVFLTVSSGFALFSFFWPKFYSASSSYFFFMSSSPSFPFSCFTISATGYTLVGGLLVKL